MSTAQLHTFADGVFAIAATLLILDVTADARGHRLSHALEHSWPQYAAYAVSFLTIAIIWVSHQACFDLIGHADRRFLFNVVFLACVAFIPFPTRLVAEHLRDGGLRAAAVAYGLISRACLPGAPSYGLATLVAVLSPIASVILFAAIALFYVLESSLFGREAPSGVEPL